MPIEDNPHSRTEAVMQRNAVVVLVLVVLVLLGYATPASAQEEPSVETVVRRVADNVLEDATFRFVDPESNQTYAAPGEAPAEARLHLASAYNDWRYWNGVLNIAMLQLADVLEDSTYAAFAERNVAFGFDHYRHFEEQHDGEDKWSYPFGQHFILRELDDGGAMGASVIEVYRRDPQARYRTYIDDVAEHMTNGQDRLADGTFVRTFPHEWTLWADDLYMALVFMARMGELTGELHYFDDAAQQVIHFHQYLFDEQQRLMYHNWYSDVGRQGVAFWGRANGWALVAQVDLLDRLPDDHPQRDTLLTLFRRHILGVARYQGPDGLWHQLLDKTDAYLETSATAMFTYAVARAVNQGYLEPRYASIAQRGWAGIASKVLPDGQMEGVCTGTVVSDDLVYYYQRPAPLNDVHGIGTVLLAGAEVLRLPEDLRP
ncbi:MAG TPA: glycoside hydrolase family 88 protein [Rhodothermales bacterium]|nr:glycoside hydrolase family 88 protein [Rhodothermales bacterium]